jgi:hypothetical protein
MTVLIASVLFAIVLMSGISLVRAIPPRWRAAIGWANIALAITAIALAVVAKPLESSSSFYLAMLTLAAAGLGGIPTTGAVLSTAMRDSANGNASLALPGTIWIGAFERFGFVLALILGLPTVAAIIVGVKALGTYAVSGKSKNVLPATRVLGTLVSVSWALLVYAILAIAIPAFAARG